MNVKLGKIIVKITVFATKLRYVSIDVNFKLETVFFFNLTAVKKLFLTIVKNDRFHHFTVAIDIRYIYLPVIFSQLYRI